MITSTPLRGLLRGLRALPLIGGGLKLIGTPTATALPVTEPRMRRYIDWLAQEDAEDRVRPLQLGRRRDQSPPS
jgi:hypothetical protein